MTGDGLMGSSETIQQINARRAVADLEGELSFPDLAAEDIEQEDANGGHREGPERRR